MNNGNQQPVHVIICGGRDFKARNDDGARLCQYLFRAAEKGPVVVHHGDCRGADRWAAELAKCITGVSVVAHPADWDKYGRQAGPMRNVEMFRKAHDAAGRPPVVVAYPGGNGTAHMLSVAREGRARIIEPHEGGA